MEALIVARNLTIEHLTIVGYGMKHINTSAEDIKEKLIVFHSALFVQNSTDISLNGVNFFDNNGIGLSLYDTNGTVTIKFSFHSNNTAKIFFSIWRWGIYIELYKLHSWKNCL